MRSRGNVSSLLKQLLRRLIEEQQRRARRKQARGKVRGYSFMSQQPVERHIGFKPKGYARFIQSRPSLRFNRSLDFGFDDIFLAA